MLRKIRMALAVALGYGSVSDTQQAAASALIESSSRKATAGWGIGSMFVGLATSHQFWSVVVGALGVFGGMWITWYFNHRKDRREQALAEAQINALNLEAKLKAVQAEQERLRSMQGGG